MYIETMDIKPYEVPLTNTSPSPRPIRHGFELTRNRAPTSEKDKQNIVKQSVTDVVNKLSDYYYAAIDESTVLETLEVLLSHTDDSFDLSEAISSYYEAITLVSNEIVSNTELTDALNDLHQATEEAQEEGFPDPGDIAIRNSEELVKKIYSIFSSRFEVYPTQDGEIAINIYNGRGSSVILFCDSTGGTLCMVNINGNSRRAHYSIIDSLPDGFVKEALKELNT